MSLSHTLKLSPLNSYSMGLWNNVISSNSAILYSSDFLSDDRTQQDTAAASLVHDPAISHPNVAGNGAMVFGAAGEAWASSSWRVDVDPLRDVLLVAAWNHSRNTAGLTGFVYFQYRDASDNVLETESFQVVDGNTLHIFQPTPHVDADHIRISLQIVGNNVDPNPTRLALCGLYVYDVTGIAGVPVPSGSQPHFYAEQGYVGTPMPAIDVAAMFTGTDGSTIYGYAGPEPHSWNGSQLTITPAAETSGGWSDGTVTREITARNGTLTEVDTADLTIRVDADPALLTALSIPTQRIELGKPMVPIYWESHISGGAWPITVEVLSTPSWVNSEPNGLLVSPEADTIETTSAQVRLTDAKGDVVTLTFPLEVIAVRDRTADHVVPDGSDLAVFIAARGLGLVYELTPGNSYTWGNMYGLAIAGDSLNPTIIRGSAMTDVGGLSLDECYGMTFENLRFGRSAEPSTRYVFTVTCKPETTSDIIFNDCEFEAFEKVIDPDEVGAGWLTTDAFAYYGSGLSLSQRSIAVNCLATKCYEGFGLTGSEAGLYNCESRAVRDDGAIMNIGRGQVIHDHTIRGFGGNYTSSDHRDLLQAFNDNKANSALRMEGMFGSCFGPQGLSEAQGVHIDHDGWDRVDRTFSRTITAIYNGVYIRNSVFLGGQQTQGLMMERMIAEVDRAVVLSHPDHPNTSSDMNTRIRRASEVQISNSIYHGLDIIQPDNSTVMVTNSVDMDAAGAPAYTDIFPNWNNTGLSYEDPCDAVANGQPASAARFWIDPASAWSIANPLIGPSWLRDGIGPKRYSGGTPDPMTYTAGVVAASGYRGATVTVALPAHAAGDSLFIPYRHSDAGDPAAPAGWTKVNVGLYWGVMYRIADGTETSVDIVSAVAGNTYLQSFAVHGGSSAIRASAVVSDSMTNQPTRTIEAQTVAAGGTSLAFWWSYAGFSTTSATPALITDGNLFKVAFIPGEAAGAASERTTTYNPSTVYVASAGFVVDPA